MSLTLAEALQSLPILSSARVVAGEKGLQRAILWTHIVDQPEVFSWVREGDLLLTTAFALKDHPESELVMVEQMAQKGLAGMLVSIGRYINAVPPETITRADALNFPIVVIPWEIPLVEVTHAIHERIIRDQYRLTEQIYHIHDVLSQLVLEGGGLAQLAVRLSELLQCSVTIEDDTFQLQAHASLEPVDDARLYSIEKGHTHPGIVKHLAASGFLDRLKTDPKPQHVALVPSLGMTLERIIAPILVGQDLYGYIWIIASQRALVSLDMLAIERAAHIAALILTREQSVFAAEQRLKASLIENLMDPSGLQSSYVLQETMQKFGLHGSCQVILLEMPETNPSRMAALVRSAEQILTDKGLPGVVLEWSQRLLLILSTTRELSPEDIAQKLVERWMAHGSRPVAGISAPFKDPEGVRTAFQQAVQALQAGAALGKHGAAVWSYERLGYLPWLVSSGEDRPGLRSPGNPGSTHSANKYRLLIERMAQHDQHNSTEFLDTLESYLNNHLNAAQTARALFIHRNSLLKRLNRIQQLWAPDFSDPYFVLNLHLALLEHRLNPPIP